MDQNQFLMLMLMYKQLNRKKKNSVPELPSAARYKQLKETLSQNKRHPDVDRLFGKVNSYDFEDLLLNYMLNRCADERLDKDIIDKDNEQRGEATVYDHIREYADSLEDFLQTHIFDVTGTPDGYYFVELEEMDGEHNFSTLYRTDNREIKINNVELNLFATHIASILCKVYYKARNTYRLVGGCVDYIGSPSVRGIYFYVCDGKAVGTDITFEVCYG